MKSKYFNVLTENEKQKTQLKELASSECNKDMELRALTKERDNYINELYRSRMDINKKINLLEEKNSAIEQLTKRLQCETERAQKILTQDQKISQLKSDILQYMQMLKQVQKHLKTLMKYLHD